MKADRRNWLRVFMVAVVDCIVVFDAFSLAYILRFQYQLAFTYHPPASPAQYLKAMAVVAWIWILLLEIHGLYEFTRVRSTIDTLHLLTRAVTFGTVIVLSLSYFYREFTYSRLVCVYAWVISILLFGLYRGALNLWQRELFRRGRGVRRVLIIGSRSLARFLVERMRGQPELGYRVVGAVDDDPPSPRLGCELLGGIDDLESLARTHRVDGVFIAHPVLPHLRLLEVIHACEQLDIPISMAPPTYDLNVNYRDFREIDGIPFVAVNERERRPGYELAKRVFDIVAALAGLVLLAPACLVISILIRLEDRGPVFFSQVRVGRDGRLFRMLKFRTMVVEAEALLPGLVDLGRLEEPVFKLDADPRVTRVGRFLRRSSLDEIPQLFNVLRGEMSLVGPRPEELEVVKRYGVWERRRLKAKPGLTGLQQIECRGSVSLRERVRWDIVYLRRRSWILDAWICLKTVWVVLRGRGAR